MKKDTFFRFVSLSGLVGGMGIIVFSASVTSALTYQSESDVDFAFNPVLTVSVSDDLNISDLAPGTFSDSNAVQVTVSTNNAYGYTLSATVGDTENNLSNELRHSTYVSSGDPIFSSIATNADLARATFSSDSTYDNKWGLATSNDGNTWGNYNGLPVTGGESAMELLSANYTPTNGTASKYVRIGARASSTQYSGTYTNVINFVAVGGVEPEPPVYMQDLTSSTIAALLPNVGNTTTAIDRRDGKEYTIGKLADGKYWMLENLALDITAVSLNDLKGTSTNPNTNALDATLGYLKNGGGTTSDKYATSGVTKAWTSSNSYSDPMIAVDSNTSGPCRYDAYYDYCVNDPGSSQWSSTSVTQQTIDSVTSIAQGKIGVYYNYCAVSAGSYCYGSGTSADTSSGNASEDICPAGWRLPTGGGSGEFNTLYATGYSSDVTDFQTAFQTPLSGYFGSGTASLQGWSGYFWSSTYSSFISMYGLIVEPSSVNPSVGNSRDFGRSVRCILSN